MCVLFNWGRGHGAKTAVCERRVRGVKRSLLYRGPTRVLGENRTKTQRAEEEENMDCKRKEREIHLGFLLK